MAWFRLELFTIKFYALNKIVTVAKHMVSVTGSIAPVDLSKCAMIVACVQMRTNRPCVVIIAHLSLCVISAHFYVALRIVCCTSAQKSTGHSDD